MDMELPKQLLYLPMEKSRLINKMIVYCSSPLSRIYDLSRTILLDATKLRSKDITSGQTLIEVLIALGAAVTIVVAISTVVITALNNAQFSRSQVLAVQHATEGIEFMRKLRDSDWNTFSSYATGTYCFNQNATSLVLRSGTCGQNVDGFFVREIEIEKSASNCQPANPPDPTPTSVPTNGTKISSIVYWTDSKCTSGGYCHSTKQVTCLTNYTIIPTP
jgi:Tfp pilus assembly protein PilV